MEWGFIFTVGGFIVGLIALFVASKKLVMVIKPKTKSGNIDMSKSNYILERHVNSNVDAKKKNTKK
jgi:hypothetical protein